MNLVMSVSEYVKRECEANALSEIACYLLQTDEPAYYADRHVSIPPRGLELNAACLAGLALLREWTREVSSLISIGLVASKPTLVVDQEWLDALPGAPLPHVLVTLAKDSSYLPLDQLNALPSSKIDFPCKELLSGMYDTVDIFKMEASPERESLGGWIFRLNL